MKTARLISVTILAMAALTACSSDQGGGNDVPSSWIRQEYSGAGPFYTDSSDAASKVAKEIEGHTSAVDRLSDDDMVFLRYRNDIVAISPYQSGSRIEIDDYRSGYNRWRSHLGTWPAPESDDFRGGGSGSGK